MRTGWNHLLPLASLHIPSYVTVTCLLRDSCIRAVVGIVHHYMLGITDSGDWILKQHSDKKKSTENFVTKASILEASIRSCSSTSKEWATNGWFYQHSSHWFCFLKDDFEHLNKKLFLVAHNKHLCDIKVAYMCVGPDPSEILTFTVSFYGFVFMYHCKWYCIFYLYIFCIPNTE